MLDGATPEAVRPLIHGALAGIVAEATVTTAPVWTNAYADLSHAKQLADDACSTEAEAVGWR